MEKLQKLSENYQWARMMSSKVVVELKKTTEMLEVVHSNFFQKFNTTNTKFNALAILDNAPAEGMMLSEIGDMMVVTKANMTGLIDRLEKDGFVERVRDVDDRRKIRAVLTPVGKSFIADVRNEYALWIENFMEDEQEVKELFSIMDKVQRRIISLQERI